MSDEFFIIYEIQMTRYLIICKWLHMTYKLKFIRSSRSAVNSLDDVAVGKKNPFYEDKKS